MTVEAVSPYEAVEKTREVWKNNLTNQDNSYLGTEIANIIPVHNPSGIRDYGQIGQMRQGIASGQEINERNNFPNIKLVVVPNGKLLLFDGTHSLLAYFHEGKKKLGEVPFLVISGENKDAVSSEEIAYFFPKEEKQKIVENWENYVVNWQTEEGKQLEARKVNSVSELARELGEADKSTVE